MVASRGVVLAVAATNRVSIPFIAGQWSLLAAAATLVVAAALVSIPFIAGQWSLREALHTAMKRFLESQSPSLRGSGRFSGSRSKA